MGHRQTDIVASIIGIGIGIAKVDFVKLAHGLSPGVAQPAGCLAGLFL